jgi:hypothetical protein
VVASVQYRAIAEKASDAFYRLTNTKEQIQSYVFDGMEGFLWCFGIFTYQKRNKKILHIVGLQTIVHIVCY